MMNTCTSIKTVVLSAMTLLSVRTFAAPIYRDLADDTSHQTVIAQGTEKAYHGHPTMLRTQDGRHLAVWNHGHGGPLGPMAESSDGGKTWTRVDDRLPKEALENRYANCPSIYAMTNPADGKRRLWIFAQRGMADKTLLWMPRIMSEDEGKTWRVMPPLGKGFECIMTFSSIVQLKDGAYLGLYHSGPGGADRAPRKLYGAITRDGGLTWEKPFFVAEEEGRCLCEPYVFRSPTNPDELCCLIREQTHKDTSRMIFSRDEGKTWSKPVPTSHVLTGDRHAGVTLPDGRLAIAFRDCDRSGPYNSHFVLWVGTYAQLRGAEEGGLKFRLLRSHAGWDCGYPGISVEPDGSLLCVTYIKYRPGKERNSIVAVRVPKTALTP